MTFSAIPVTIESNFALRLGNDFAFLIGQQADFYIAGTGLTFDQHSWTPGHTAIGDVELSGHTVNNVEAAGSLYPSGQWSYYETRETHPVTNLGSSNPSWFYEGAQNLRRRVHSTFRIKVGSVVLDSVTISRRLQVYAPIIRSTSIPGPVSILDANPAQTNDEEFAQAGKVGGAPGFVVISQILLPVEFASGNGKWAYVHLIRSEIWNGTSTSYFPKGLDNLYPYPSSTDGLSDPYRIDWKPLGGTSNRLTFSDSPSYSISTLSAYVDSMEGWCFAVIRPPVQQGQDWVDLPIMLQPWTYESESLRTPQTKWIQTSLYTYVGSNLWETIPICPGVQKGTISYYVLSEDMDWDYVFGNQ